MTGKSALHLSASVLATKVRVPPPRPHLVPRPRLFARLQEGAGYDLVLVSAPAGFGKTTLLSQWIHESPMARATCWLSLDEGDNDPIRFWGHFVAALMPLGPAVAQDALDLLHSPVPLPPESFLTTLVNNLAAVNEDFAVFLDDYHFIGSPVIQSGITFLIDHMPARMQLVLAGRADPPLPLARYRGRGTLLEIGADDLRFTSGEATSLLKELMHVQPASQHAEALHQRTEGWAVGLKMAALSMQHVEDVSAFVRHFAGSQRFIMDYLMEEVLQRQPEEVRRFMLETSLLDSFTGSLCDAVTGRTDSEAMVRSLERANLFVVPQDDPRVWYRYEHLFADVLRHQLEKGASPESVAELHRRAARWYERHELPRDAINHSLAAQDWDRAADLLAVESLRLEQTGEMLTLLGWLQTVPREVLRRRPRLQLSHVGALVFTSQLEAAEKILTELEEAADLDEATRGRAVAHRAVIATLRGEQGRAMELSEAALQLLPPEEFLFRGMLSLNLGAMYLSKGRLKEAEVLQEEAYKLGRRVENRWITALASAPLCFIALVRGRLSQAVDQTEREIEFAGNSPAAAYSHGYLASFLYERNDLEAAQYHLDKSAELGRLLAMAPETVDEAYRVRMLIKLTRGDHAGALEVMNQIDLWVAGDDSKAAKARQACHHLALALRRRDEEEGSRWGQALEVSEGPLPWNQPQLLLSLAILQGRKEQVDAEIRAFYDRLHIDYLSPEWPYWRIKARICQALAAPGWTQAREFFTEALALARPERYIRLFADQGLPLVPLLRKAVSEGPEAAFAVTLLSIIEAEERLAGAVAGGSAHAAGGLGLLTEREIEILRLVAANLSNGEIARRLFITVGTVKVHVHHISEKLNATSRAKAVAQARMLHLI